METTYNGACMALPDRDEDLFAQINEKTAHRRRQREAQEALYFDNVYADREPEAEDQSRILDLGRILPWLAGTAALLAGMLLGRLM